MANEQDSFLLVDHELLPLKKYYEARIAQTYCRLLFRRVEINITSQKNTMIIFPICTNFVLQRHTFPIKNSYDYIVTSGMNKDHFYNLLTNSSRNIMNQILPKHIVGYSLSGIVINIT